jgi:hypothetical protein
MRSPSRHALASIATAALLGASANALAQSSVDATSASEKAGENAGEKAGEKAGGAMADSEPVSSFIRSRQTDGFMAFETATRVYRRPDGTGPVVALVGVVHIGDKRYYDEIVRILEQSEVVLYESVLPRGAFGTRGATDLERQRKTQDAMIFLRGLAQGFERANGRAPRSLAELRAFTVSRDTRLARPFDLACVDGWGGRVGFAAAGERAYAFVSLGSDAARGGADAALDLVLPRLVLPRIVLPRPVLPRRGDATAANADSVKSTAAKDEQRDLYKEFADALGVALQVRSIDYDRAGWEPADLPMEELLDRLWKRGERSVTLEMLSQRDGIAQGMLRFFLSLVSQSRDFKKMVITALGTRDAREAQGGGALSDVDERIIIHERNDAVIDELAHVLGRADAPSSVAIFYGAAHMGDFEPTLRERWGLEPAEATWSVAMSVEEWSAERIDARIKMFEGLREKTLAHDPAGAYPACARYEWRIEELQSRAASIAASR